MTQATPSNSNRIHIVIVAALVIGSVIAMAPMVAPAQAQQSGDVVGQPDIEFATATGEVTAGTADELTFTITNRGEIFNNGPAEYEDAVTTARAMTIDINDEDVPIDVKAGQLSVGAVPVGSIPKSVPITVAESVEPGTYEIPIEYEYLYTRHIEYDSSGAERTEYTRTKTSSITVDVKKDARFEVLETTGTAQVGAKSDVEMTLRNTGTQTASSATVSVNSRTKSLTFDAGTMSSSAYAGEWNPGENRTLSFQVALAPDATARSYTLDLSVSYEDSDGISKKSRPLTAGIQSLDEQSFAFSNLESTLRVGEDGDITGTVENTGPKPAESVVVRYADESPTVIPIEQSAAVGDLAAGESASFTLPIEVSGEAESGSKSIDMAVSYRNTDGDRRLYEKLDVQAAVAPQRDQFDVALTNRTVATGGSETLSVEVTNNLDETVTDVEGRLFADDPLDTGETDSGYVESLEPGETTTVAFEVTASGSAIPGKTYPISFDFRYDDADGDSHISDTVRVAIDAVESEDGGGLPISLILVGVVIVAVAGGAVWYRRQ